MSPEPRYTVSVTHGDRIHLPPRTGGVPRSHAPQLGATVHDRAYCYREVAAFASEDPSGPGKRLGCSGAIAAANEHAARLNAPPA